MFRNVHDAIMCTNVCDSSKNSRSTKLGGALWPCRSAIFQQLKAQRNVLKHQDTFSFQNGFNYRPQQFIKKRSRPTLIPQNRCSEWHIENARENKTTNASKNTGQSIRYSLKRKRESRVCWETSLKDGDGARREDNRPRPFSHPDNNVCVRTLMSIDLGA